MTTYATERAAAAAPAQAVEPPPAVRPHAAALEKALPGLDAERAALFDEQGRPKLRDDLHAEALGAWREKAAATIGALVEKAERQRGEFLAEAERVEAVAGADPLLSLDAGQLARVRTLEPLIVADVAAMTGPRLATVLGQARTRGDRVELVLYARAAAAWLEGHAAKRSTPPEASAVAQHIAAIRATLSPGQAEAATKAATLRKMAGDLAVFSARARTAAQDRTEERKRFVTL